MIDLGEAAAEQLGLALDPYPRMPGVEMPDGRGRTGPASVCGVTAAELSSPGTVGAAMLGHAIRMKLRLGAPQLDDANWHGDRHRLG